MKISALYGTFFARVKKVPKETRRNDTLESVLPAGVKKLKEKTAPHLFPPFDKEGCPKDRGDFTAAPYIVPHKLDGEIRCEISF